MPNIFVFGSNVAGRHGMGAAKTAVESHGARYGQGVGLHGNSYAIPTKDRELMTLPVEAIEGYVKAFIEFAVKYPELTFNVTAIGCGLAGYTAEDIAPLFSKVPKNCVMPERFKYWISNPEVTYWDS
jgi:hypothetical protein